MFIKVLYKILSKHSADYIIKLIEIINNYLNNWPSTVSKESRRYASLSENRSASTFEITFLCPWKSEVTYMKITSLAAFASTLRHDKH
jgi:hypothetical protein